VCIANELEAEAIREQELSAFYRGTRLNSADADPDNSATVVSSFEHARATIPATEELSDEDDAVMRRDREATKHRLRELGEPATFFGEDDASRAARLRRCELCRDQDVLASGSTNVMQLIDRRAERDKIIEWDDIDYALSLQHTVARARPGISGSAVCAAAGESRGGDSSAQDGSARASEGNGSAFVVADVEGQDDGADSTDLETQMVVKWLRATLREWEAALLARAPAEHGSAAFKAEKAHFRQSKQYLKPLRKSLRDSDIQPSIVAALAEIALFCDKRQYREAKEAYMRLAIGNSPWPMGVTFVTFHDRPNRHNIGEGTVAHVLDDETTRKYVQMVKRLLSFCEARWPVDPSRAA